jgi:hypothetical protein
VELGNLINVGKWYAEQGIINPTTGRNFTKAAISYAARRWVCECPEEALEYYKRLGWHFEQDELDAWMARTIVKCFHSHSRETIANLLDKNGIRDKYGYIIGEEAKS